MNTTTRKLLLRAARVLLISVLALVVLGAATARADDPGRFAFHAGDGFGGIESPDVTAAADGGTITISAAGEFRVGHRRAHGEGTFEHRAANGTLLGSGSFRVRRLDAFDFFGCGVAGGQIIPANLCGGRAVFEVKVVAHPAAGGTERFNATLVVTCLVGNQVPAGAEEGVTVDVPGLVSFDRPISGETLLVSDVDEDDDD